MEDSNKKSNTKLHYNLITISGYMVSIPKLQISKNNKIKFVSFIVRNNNPIYSVNKGLPDYNIFYCNYFGSALREWILRLYKPWIPLLLDGTLITPKYKLYDKYNKLMHVLSNKIIVRTFMYLESANKNKNISKNNDNIKDEEDYLKYYEFCDKNNES